MACGGYGGLFSALYSSFVLDVKTTTTEVKIPFITEKSTAEFVLNCALQFTIFIHGCASYIGIECAMAILENFAKVSTEIIRNEIVQMNDSNKRKELSEFQLRTLFKNILLQLHDFDRCVMLRFKSFFLILDNPFKYELILWIWISPSVYSSYLIRIRESLYWRTFFTPFLYTYSIAMSIFCQFSVSKTYFATGNYFQPSCFIIL